MDSLEERVKGFFKKCGSTPNLKQEWKDEQFGKVKEVEIIYCGSSIKYVLQM